jgi:1-aminocyclopropane-1-carboxylate deaminase/D-cysteine desulfhydrase-like pyridoxal-dependent ACC family enzyme
MVEVANQENFLPVAICCLKRSSVLLFKLVGNESDKIMATVANILIDGYDCIISGKSASNDVFKAAVLIQRSIATAFAEQYKMAADDVEAADALLQANEVMAAYNKYTEILMKVVKSNDDLKPLEALIEVKVQ